MTNAPAGLTAPERSIRDKLADTAHKLELLDTDRITLVGLLDELDKLRARDPFATLRRFAGALAEARDQAADEPDPEPSPPPLADARHILAHELAELILDDDVDLRESERAAAVADLATALDRLDTVIRRGDAVEPAALEAEVAARYAAETRVAALELAVDNVLNRLDGIPGGYFEPAPLKPFLGAIEELDRERRA